MTENFYCFFKCFYQVNITEKEKVLNAQNIQLASLEGLDFLEGIPKCIDISSDLNSDLYIADNKEYGYIDKSYDGISWSLDLEFLEAAIGSIVEDIFLEYFNDYLTVEKFAEDHNYSVDTATLLINAGRKYHESE